MSLLLLSDSRIPARAHVWPGDHAVAHVVVLDSAIVASASTWVEWSRQLGSRHFTTMRTGALASRQAHQAEAAGMWCIQELALLEARPPLVVPSRGARSNASGRLQRLRSSGFEEAAAVDRAAFGEMWRLDEPLLRDVCNATPTARARTVIDDDGMSGFLISGRAGAIGFIQRLAVHPRAHRRGTATALMADSMRWLRRRGCTRVLVNTHVDNAAALALYARFGFVELPERLRVFEGSTITPVGGSAVGT